MERFTQNTNKLCLKGLLVSGAFRRSNWEKDFCYAYLFEGFWRYVFGNQVMTIGHHRENKLARLKMAHEKKTNVNK